MRRRRSSSGWRRPISETKTEAGERLGAKPLPLRSSLSPSAVPGIEPRGSRRLPGPGNESASTIERGVDPIGLRHDELDPAIGQVVTPEEPGAEMARDDLADVVGMVEHLNAF